jgi:hypothetical protein
MGPDGHALLGSQQHLRGKASPQAFPDDRQVQGKTHIGSIGMRVKSYREAIRHQPREWSIGI